jgi:calcium uniporter protein, mitochondrial
MGGYIWFLWHNREVSYRSAMNITISRRQSKLYQARGFDLEKWQALIEDGNALRKEIKAIANEYDVEWDERKDEGQDEKVAEALKKEREKKRGKKDEGGKDDDSSK